MTYEEKKAWLWRYRDACKKADYLRDARAEAQSDTGRTTQQLSGMPAGGGDGQALPRSVERIEDAQLALDDQLYLCDQLKCELLAKLLGLTDPDDHEIMRRRYVCFQKWERIAQDLQISQRQVYRHHRKAIDLLRW